MVQKSFKITHDTRNLFSSYQLLIFYMSNQPFQPFTGVQFLVVPRLTPMWHSEANQSVDRKTSRGYHWWSVPLESLRELLKFLVCPSSITTMMPRMNHFLRVISNDCLRSQFNSRSWGWFTWSLTRQSAPQSDVFQVGYGSYCSCSRMF